MATRRPLTATPLLVASSALVLGCQDIVDKITDKGAVTGNLVAPPMYELCVDTEPADALVQIDGVDLEEDGCSSVYEGSHEVTADAAGYAAHTETVEVLEDTTIAITLTADTGAR